MKYNRKSQFKLKTHFVQQLSTTVNTLCATVDYNM